MDKKAGKRSGCVYLAVNLTPPVPSGWMELLYTDSISGSLQGVPKIRSNRINPITTSLFEHIKKKPKYLGVGWG